MAWHYDSPSGDPLAVTGCGEHIQLVVPSGTVCIAYEDAEKFISEIRARLPVAADRP